MKPWIKAKRQRGQFSVRSGKEEPKIELEYCTGLLGGGVAVVGDVLVGREVVHLLSVRFPMCQVNR